MYKAKVFRFKADRPPVDIFPLNRIKPLPRSDEGLTGLVHGIPASDIEERFARALDRLGIPYEFQKNLLAPANLPGNYKLDFLVYNPKDGRLYPIAVDGEFAHKSAEQRAKDKLKDIVLNSAKQGEYQPVERLDYTKLDNQEIADQTTADLFG
jgi:hypothetical protein